MNALLPALALATLCFVGSAPAPAAQPKRAVPGGVVNVPQGDAWIQAIPSDAVLRTLSFYHARRALADKMSAAVPSLAERVRAEAAALQEAHGAGFDALLSEAARREPGFRTRWESEFKAKAEAMYPERTWTPEQAAALLDKGLLDPRRQPPSVLGILCAVNPTFRADPVQELKAGYTQTADVPVVGDAARRLVLVTPASWRDVTPAAVAGQMLQVASGMGAGPVTGRIEAVALPAGEASPSAAQLEAMLVKYGFQGSAGMTLQPIEVTEVGGVRLARRQISARLMKGMGAVRFEGTQVGVVKDGTLVMFYLAAFVDVPPSGAAPSIIELRQVLARYLPVMDAMREGLRITTDTPTAP